MRKPFTKVLLTLIFTMSLLFLNLNAEVKNNGVQTTTNDKIIMSLNSIPLELINKPFLKDGTVWVPVCETIKKLGSASSFDTKTKEVKAVIDSKIYLLQEGCAYARQNGMLTKLEYLPIAADNDLMVPLDWLISITDFKMTKNQLNINIISNEKTNNKAEIDPAVRDIQMAGKLKTELGIPEAELYRMKNEYGNWRDVIIKLVGDGLEQDDAMATKFQGSMRLSEEYLLNLKYQLDDWPSVAYYIYMGREKSNKPKDEGYVYRYTCEVTEVIGGGHTVSYPVRQKKFVKYTNSDINYATKISGLVYTNPDIIAAIGNQQGWTEVFKIYSKELLAAASNMGMPDYIIAKLQELKFTSFRIYQLAIDAFANNDDYNKVYEDLSKISNPTDVYEYFRINCSSPKKLLLNETYNEKVSDKRITLLINEFGITSEEIDNLKNNGIDQVIQIAQFKNWGINNAVEMQNMITLSERYNIALNKVHEVAVNHLTWLDIDNELKKMVQSEKKDI